MALKFFPRNRQFWLYHLVAVLLTGTITLVTAYLWGSLSASYIVASIAWVAPYTLATLGFRWIYQQRHWQARSMAQLIPWIVAYGTLAGLIVAALVAAAITPLFREQLQASYGPDFASGNYLLRKVVSDGLQSQLFICAWAFIYISVTSGRRIRESELDNLRLQHSLKEAQLSSLSNQLNPHFLFNALNNIRFMIHENPSQADATLIALAEVLRYSLNSREHATVRLSQEIEIIDRYLAIAGAQLEERLAFSSDVPAALLGQAIPPMMLQMLIENAIKHGLEPLPGGGRISLTARKQGARLLIQVCNDCPPQSTAATGGMGIGLGNIEQRLRLLYGANASLTKTHSGNRFEVCLSLPSEVSP